MLLALSAVSADAQRVPTRCAKAKDKVKCTCGVENGAVFVQRLRERCAWIPPASWPRTAAMEVNTIAPRFARFMPTITRICFKADPTRSVRLGVL